MTEKTGKRSDYISWDDYFMAVAFLSAQRSKDPTTQVGTCIVNEEKKIVGVGYNGFPIGCSDDDLPWGREGATLADTKYPYSCHSELNAIMNSNSLNLKGCTLYTAYFPCNECAKLIIQSGIRHVKYLRMYDKGVQTAQRMFALAGVTCEQFTPKQKRILIDFEAAHEEKRPSAAYPTEEVHHNKQR